MKKLEEIIEDIKSGNCDDECMRRLDEFISANPDNDEALLTRGKLHWKSGNRAGAINDLNAALRLNPKSEASTMLNSIYSILNFYDKDRYNP